MSHWWRTYPDKNHYLRAHVSARSLQRYGIRLTTADQDHIVSMIRAGQSTLLEQTSINRSTRELHYHGIDWTVVYDASRKRVVTVLPRG